MLVLWGLQLFPSTSRAAPVSKVDTVGWVADPDGRGTSDIILSCVLTLSLCVWSAMHLNIPRKDETWLEFWIRNTKWVFLGILIPELVILSAWRQWLSAKSMTKQMRKIFNKEGGQVDETGKSTLSPKLSTKQPSRRHDWTFVHSFYAGMGGFVFDMDTLPVDAEGESFIPARQRLTVTAAGVLLLAECKRLPDLSITEIKDKSKADGIAKALVCLQATWMVVQTICRAAFQQPVTLLEVNTIGHVFCAFIIYLLWWHKPRDVRAATVLQGRDMASLCSYMYMCSRVSGPKSGRKFKLGSWRQPELSGMAWFEEPKLVSTKTSNEGEQRQDDYESHQDIEITINSEYAKSDTSHGNGYMGVRPPTEAPERPQKAIKRYQTLPIESDNDTKRCLRIRNCEEAVRSFSSIRKRFDFRDTVNLPGQGPQGRPRQATWHEPELCQLVVSTAGDWPSDYYLPGIAGELMGMALWFASMGYGAVHALAWGEFFPTAAERLLWRFSSIYITGSGLLWFFMCVFGFRIRWGSVYWDRFVALEATTVEYVFFGFVAMVCGCAYILARFFLVVDAIVSLRRLPEAAYNTPNWAMLIPHL